MRPLFINFSKNIFFHLFTKFIFNYTESLSDHGTSQSDLMDKAKWKFLTSGAYTQYVSIGNKLNKH